MKIADRIRGIYDASIERVEAERKAEELRRNKNVEQDIVRAKDIAKELFNTVIHSIETEASKGNRSIQLQANKDAWNRGTSYVMYIYEMLIMEGFSFKLHCNDDMYILEILW